MTEKHIVTELKASKAQFHLFDADFEKEVVDLLTDAAGIYGPNNWKYCEDLTIYENALSRHWNAVRRGELIDPDSGRSHFVHIVGNAMFLNWHHTKGSSSSNNTKEVDNE